MKYIKKLIRFFLILFIIVLLLPLLLYIPLFIDKNFYKNLAVENVENFSDYKLSLENLELTVYPSLKVKLQNIELKTKQKQVQLLKLEELHLSIFILRIFAGGKLQIDDFSLRNGFVDIPELIASIPESNPEPERKEDSSTISSDIINMIHERVKIKQIVLENLEIKIKAFHPLIYHDPFIKKIQLRYESFLESEAGININYGKTNIILTAKGGIAPEKLELASLFFDAELYIKDIPIYEYSQFIKDFPSLNANASNLDLSIKSKKEKDQMLIANTLDVNLNSIGYVGKQGIKKKLGPITIKGNINYPLFSKKVTTNNLQVLLPNLLHLKIDSDLNFTSHPIIKASINSTFVNITPILDFIGAFSKSNQPVNEKTAEEPTKNSELFVDLKYHANKVTFEEYHVSNVFLNAVLNNAALQYKAGIIKIADGSLELSGEANLLNGVSANAYLEIENVNTEKLTTQFLGKKMAEGTLSTYIKINTNNKYGEKDFMKNLSLTGNTNLKDGVLLDRADVLYPIRFLNKIIPSEDKLNTNISRFNSIDIDYTIKNSRFKMKNLTMLGKVFNTTGTADIGLENPGEDIHANLIVSTSIAGAGLKIPMVYSKSSYVPFSIDKVWLASVYTGMVMGGPMGAMIGSALSESAGDAIKTIRDKSREQFNENKKRLLLE